MSKGTPFVSLRMRRAERDLIEEAVLSYNATQAWRRRPMTLTEFILRACREKLDHMRRSRKPRSHIKRKAA